MVDRYDCSRDARIIALLSAHWPTALDSCGGRHRLGLGGGRQDRVAYLYTKADSWKVKRIRNNPRVRVAVCNVRGDIKGPWLDATASLVEGDERLAADKLLDRKYFFKRIFNFLTRINRHTRAMIKIETA